MSVVVFQGVRNGKPRFKHVGDMPPVWLKKAWTDRAIKVDGETIRVRSKTLRPGDELREGDV